MHSKSKTLKFIAKIELFSGFIFIFLAVIFFALGENIFGQDSDSTLPFVFMLIGLISFLNAPILFLLAKRDEEKNPPVVED